MSMSHTTKFLPARCPLALAVSLLTLAAPTFAAEKVLQEVEITAQAEGYKPEVSSSAMRTPTALVDTPQSVSVVTRKQVADQAATSLAEATRYTPGLTFAQGEGNRDQVVIRGVNTTSDFFVDGIRDDVQYYRDLYNIEQLEVIKGANALAFGRGASGGAINRVIKRAGFTPVREVTLSGGMFDHYRGALDVGGKLSERVAGRINVMSEDSGSFRDGVELRRSAINPTLTFRVTDKTTVVAGAEYLNDARIADRGIPSQNRKPFETKRSRFFGNAEQSPTETTVNAAYVQLEHAFSKDVMLNNRTRFAQYDKYYQNVYAASAVDPTNNTLSLENYRDDTQRENFTSQTDVTWKVKTGSVVHQLTAGVDLERQRSENTRKASDFAECLPAGMFTCVNNSGARRINGISASNPIANAVGGFVIPLRDTETDVDVLSVYLQDTLSIGEKLQVVLGLRHDRFETDFLDNRNAANSAKVVDSELSPRAALIYKPTTNSSLYASYSKTFVPRAGDQLSSVTAANKALDPEEFENLEVGAKWDMTQRLSASAAVFQLERKNVINPAPTPGSSLLIDGARITGIEVELQGQVTDRYQVIAGYSYTDSELSVPGALNGNRLYNTPENTFSLWNRVSLTDRFGVGVGITSRDAMFANDDNTTKVPGYYRVDAAAYYKASDALALQLNIENLTDREYFLNAHNNNNITPGSPIAARLSATYKF
jgi:catecholate siderophore receptor